MMDSFSVDLHYPFPKGENLRVSFSIPLDPPSRIVIFGPSGSGKSTLLHCLAGIISPHKGLIRYRNIDWFNKTNKINLSAQDRSLALLFQDHPLFPHLSVSKNIAYGLKKTSKEDIEIQVSNWINRFGLKGKAMRYPEELSGGEKRRVALAQVLASGPNLLLLDEPFSALDLHTRTDIQRKIKEWIAEENRTVMLVTHDLAEALAFGDHFIILSEGKILQMGKPMEIFSCPALPSVAKILGIENLLPGKAIEVNEEIVTLAIGKQQLVASGTAMQKQACFAAIRAEEITLEKGATALSSARNHLYGIVQEITPHGFQISVVVDCGFLLTARITQRSMHELSLKTGMKITAVIKASAIHILPSI